MTVGHSVICARVVLDRQGEGVLGVARTSAKAAELVAERRRDVVLVDMALGDECGLDRARLLTRRGSADAPAVIFISVYSPCDLAELIATSPEAGFLPKSDLSANAPRQIVASCGRATAGGHLAGKVTDRLEILPRWLPYACPPRDSAAVGPGDIFRE
jgi:DNA-binding NarL/FixJ family response regulator